ncbi:choice-of-anchor E domain-containing protein [Nostoc sp. CMAA1605]|uniref:choice-of-anchor E domain-containing protein n=1 Tax=Nostoc sp. CMAA1605 TaxID=2055159 RepID=UPI001F23749B|nr:choice-of-anchor E domain-containing protein [Nostoc sp. CMAA1605]MCF4969770.1 PEP-CTERM sorting domain-containing protein [Nostoc sp. CMAA1605]
MTTTLFKTIGAATTLAAIALTASSANAATISYSNGTDFAVTDFTDKVINIKKFDSSLGTLKSVILEFEGTITGGAGFENRSSSPADVQATLSSNLSLKLDNILVQLNPQNVSSYQVASYDGILNYTGASGRTVENLLANQSGVRNYTDSQILQSFIGSGNLNFLFSAKATSLITGSGNMASYFDTLAKAGVKVTYDYDPVKSVPEPSAALGFGLFAVIGLLSQRQKIRLKASK